MMSPCAASLPRCQIAIRHSALFIFRCSVSTFIVADAEVRFYDCSSRTSPLPLLLMAEQDLFTGGLVKARLGSIHRQNFPCMCTRRSATISRSQDDGTA